MFELELVRATVNKEDKSQEENNNSSIERLSIFRKIVESLTEVAGEERIDININDKGLFIQVMDQMHVGLADVFLAKELFPSYRCDRNLKLGLPAKQFSTILKNIITSNKDSVKIYSEDIPQILTILHKIEDGEFIYNISLCEINKVNFKIPQQQYECSIKLLSEKFRSSTRLVGSYGEYLQMNCDKDIFSIRQQSEIMDNSLKLVNNNTTVCVSSTESLSLEVPMKYINIINKICTFTDETNIFMSQNAPVYFDFKLFEHLGFIKFFIAPKLTE